MTNITPRVISFSESYNQFDCVSIVIDKKNKVGEIYGISNFK